jgi:hypothetical protein
VTIGASTLDLELHPPPSYVGLPGRDTSRGFRVLIPPARHVPRHLVGPVGPGAKHTDGASARAHRRVYAASRRPRAPPAIPPRTRSDKGPRSPTRKGGVSANTPRAPLGTKTSKSLPVPFSRSSFYTQKETSWAGTRALAH